MPLSNSFTKKHIAIANVLKTESKVSEAFDLNSPPPHPQLKTFIALWDTGATNSVISRKVVESCNLKPIGVAQVHMWGTLKPVMST